MKKEKEKNEISNTERRNSEKISMPGKNYAHAMDSASEDTIARRGFHVVTIILLWSAYRRCAKVRERERRETCDQPTIADYLRN